MDEEHNFLYVIVGQYYVVNNLVNILSFTKTEQILRYLLIALLKNFGRSLAFIEKVLYIRRLSGKNVKCYMIILFS